MFSGPDRDDSLREVSDWSEPGSEELYRLGEHTIVVDCSRVRTRHISGCRQVIQQAVKMEPRVLIVRNLRAGDFESLGVLAARHLTASPMSLIFTSRQPLRRRLR